MNEQVHVLVLNYNGRQLLPECLPSIVAAVEQAEVSCRLSVIDNASTDDSLSVLATQFPDVPVIRQHNLGLCSFNHVLPHIEAPVAVLLNNDIKLAADAIDPLVRPLLGGWRTGSMDCFLTAPFCWQFDNTTYEGLKTAIRWRRGLVEANCRYPGYKQTMQVPDWTAASGPVMAVDRAKFLEIGGFDSVFLPGRLEDLDFAYRGYQAGYHAEYVPQSVAWHLGFGTFHDAFGADGCDQLALRNTLLFQWLNLRDPASVARQLFWLPVRAVADLLAAPFRQGSRRLAFLRACVAAMHRLTQDRLFQIARRNNTEAEQAFFARFAWEAMARPRADSKTQVRKGPPAPKHRAHVETPERTGVAA